MGLPSVGGWSRKWCRTNPRQQNVSSGLARPTNVTPRSKSKVGFPHTPLSLCPFSCFSYGICLTHVSCHWHVDQPLSTQGLDIEGLENTRRDTSVTVNKSGGGGGGGLAARWQAQMAQQKEDDFQKVYLYLSISMIALCISFILSPLFLLSLSL